MSREIYSLGENREMGWQIGPRDISGFPCKTARQKANNELIFP
jgi:hypothetical protein